MKFVEFDSEVRDAGDLAGVYEFDGEVSMFYRYAPKAPEKARIAGAIRIFSGLKHQAEEGELEIYWDDREEFVALFIRNRLTAAFDARTFKGFAAEEETPEISRITSAIRKRFED